MIRFFLSSLPYTAHVKPVNAVASRASSSRPEITHYKHLLAGLSKYVLHSFTTCNIAMSKGDFDVNTRTSELDAHLPKSRLKQRDLVLLREAGSALRTDGVHAKLTYGRWT